MDLIVPVKALNQAKSRLLGAADNGLGDPALHARLTLALARDTVAAAMAATLVRRVVVISSDPEVTAVLAADGASVLAEGGIRGLNPALEMGARALREGGAPRVALGALQADLPALRPEELDEALARASALFAGDGVATGRVDGRTGSDDGRAGSDDGRAGSDDGRTGSDDGRAAGGDGRAAVGDGGAEGRVQRAFCADADGEGTTLLVCGPFAPLQPRFGVGSAAAHNAGGAVALSGRWPGLRRDVDTVDDLWAAAELGLGPASAAALRMSSPPGAVALS